MRSNRDADFTDYMSARMPALRRLARMPALRRLARLLCQDWTQADDLLQAAMTRTYVHWSKAARAENTDAYVRAILVREFVEQRRSSWAKRVSLTDEPPEPPSVAPDHEPAIDLRAAVAALPPRKRAVLVLRYFCDLNVDQTADALGCAPGTVKSQTAKALDTLRQALGPGCDATTQGPADPIQGPSISREVRPNA